MPIPFEFTQKAWRTLWKDGVRVDDRAKGFTSPLEAAEFAGSLGNGLYEIKIGDTTEYELAVNVTIAPVTAGNITLSSGAYGLFGGESINAQVQRAGGNVGGAQVRIQLTGTSSADFDITEFWTNGDDAPRNIFIGSDTVSSQEIGSLTLTDLDGTGNLGLPQFGAITSATVTIDPLLPVISIDNPEVDEGDSGTTDLVFTVSLSFAASSDVTFDWSTADGTATAGSDYIAVTNQPATITAGNTSTTLTVQVIGDTALEPDETVDVNLTNIVGATAS